MAKTKKSPHSAEVAALSDARFGPQVQAIMMLLQQARQDRQQGIDVARSTGASVRGLAEKAQPQAQASLTQALTGISAARTQMPGVAPGAQGAIAAGSQRDMALGESNAQAQAQRTRDELVSRAQDAQTGAAQGVLQAQAQYGKTRNELAQQIQNLGAQQGAFASAELARLVAADTKRAQQVTDREDSQAFQRSQQQRGFDHTDANRKPPVSKVAKGERRAQKAFVKAVADVSLWTYEVEDPKTGDVVVKPVNAAWVKQNRSRVEAKLRKDGLSAELARRAADAYIKVGQGDPGSFKKYRAGKVGSAVGGVKVPANPFA